MTRIEERYCHSTTCSLFNEPQEFRYQPSTWDEPSEWIDEPYCEECHGDCHELMSDEEADE